MEKEVFSESIVFSCSFQSVFLFQPPTYAHSAAKEIQLKVQFQSAKFALLREICKTAS